MSDFWLLIPFLGNSSYRNFPLNYVLNIYSNKGDVHAIVVVFIVASCCDCYSSHSLRKHPFLLRPQRRRAKEKRMLSQSTVLIVRQNLK